MCGRTTSFDALFVGFLPPHPNTLQHAYCRYRVGAYVYPTTECPTSCALSAATAKNSLVPRPARRDGSVTPDERDGKYGGSVPSSFATPGNASGDSGA